MTRLLKKRAGYPDGYKSLKNTFLVSILIKLNIVKLVLNTFPVIEGIFFLPIQRIYKIRILAYCH